ncbi:MAG: PAS domain S-box protein, partial [Pyrinomonadaceae bacterium]
MKSKNNVPRDNSPITPLPFSILVDNAGVIRSATEYARRYLPTGAGPDQARLANLVHPDDIPKVADWLAQIQSDPSTSPGGDFRIVTTDGNEHLIRGVFVASVQAGELAYSLAGFDITEQSTRYAELRATEAKFNDLLENATDLIYTTDLDGNFLTINGACERVLGYTPEDVGKLNISDLIPAEHLTYVRETVTKKLSGIPVPVYETDVITRSGERIAVEISSHLLYENGQPIGLQGIARVVTDRKRTALALRSSQERFAKAFAAGPIAMMIGRLSDGVIVDANFSALELYGYEREQLIGHSTIELNIWPTVESRTKAIQQLQMQGSLRDYPVELNTRQGYSRHLILSAELITLDDVPC